MSLTRFTFFLLLLFSFSAHAWNTPTSAFKGAKYTAWTWTGASGDHNWNNGANWCGTYLNNACQGQGGAPTAASNIVFNDACTGANCNVTMPGTPVTVKNFQISDTYTGTITQGATNLTIDGSFSQAGGTFNQTTGFINLSLDTSSWYMYGGTFNGGSANITVNQPNNGNGAHFALTGGSFRSTSGTLSINVAYNEIQFSSTGFNANNGTLYLSTGSHTSSDANITWPATTLHNVIIDGTAGKSLTLLNDATLDGNLTLTTGGSSVASATLNGPGKFYVQGNVIHSGDFSGGAAVVLSGTGLQVVDSTGSAVNHIGFIGLTLQQTAVSGSVRFDGDIKIAGSFIALAASNLGTVNLNGAQFEFASASGVTSTYDSDMITFPNLTISAVGPNSKFGVLNVSGNLTTTYNSNCTVATANGGVIKVGGNIDATAGSLCGSTMLVELNGAGAQVINTGGSSLNKVPGVRINKATGTVEFRNSVDGKFKVDGDFNFVSGGIALTALTMPTVTDLSLGNAGTTITTSGYQFPASVVIHFLSNGNGANIYFADDMTVLGSLMLDTNTSYAPSITSLGGVVRYVVLSGSITAVGGSKGFASAGTNPAWVKFVGSTHTVDYSAAASGAHVPAMENIGTGTVTMTSLAPVNLRGLKNTGTFDGTNANVVLQVTAGTTTYFPGPAVFGTVSTDLSGGLTINTGETLRVNGNFTYTSQVTSRPINGDIVVKGNIASTGVQAAVGTATVTMTGNSSTWSRTIGQPQGLITISKTAGQTVTLTTAVSLAAGQSVSVTSGSIDMNVFNLTIPGTLTLASGTSVKLNGGILTVGGSVIPAGPYSGGTIVP